MRLAGLRAKAEFSFFLRYETWGWLPRLAIGGGQWSDSEADAIELEVLFRVHCLQVEPLGDPPHVSPGYKLVLELNFDMRDKLQIFEDDLLFLLIDHTFLNLESVELYSKVLLLKVCLRIKSLFDLLEGTYLFHGNLLTFFETTGVANLLQNGDLDPLTFKIIQANLKKQPELAHQAHL